MKKQHKIYWICQLTGWISYSLINLIFFELSAKSSFKDYIIYILIIPSGVFISHAYRFLLKKFNALKSSIYSQLALAVLGSLVKASLLFSVLAFFSSLFHFGKNDFDAVNIASSIINFAVVFFIWNTIYFSFHYFINYKQAEIDKFKLEVAQKESELNSLKSQLNPHFMFNSMNSIRALIEEDPQKAKRAITQLSNILRNSLLINKNRVISLNDEIQLVQDYLELEKIRYEERLSFNLKIDPNTQHIRIPPFIIQGLAENAIKHGISKLATGGFIEIESKLSEQGLTISVTNSGKLNHEKSETGLGISNTKQRLQLIYGTNSYILMNEQANTVNVEIFIPNQKT